MLACADRLLDDRAMVERAAFLLLITFCAVASADPSTNTAAANVTESVRRTYELKIPRPNGLGGVVYHDHGRVRISATVPLENFDVSQVGAGSIIGFQVGGLSWSRRIGDEDSWQAGESVFRAKGFDFETQTLLRSFRARWTTNALRIEARAAFAARFGHFGGGDLVGWDYLTQPPGLYTNAIPFTMFLLSVSDDAPGQTNAVYGITNLTLVTEVNTKSNQTRYGPAIRGWVKTGEF